MTAEVSLADSVNYVIDIDEPKEVVSREVLESERGPEVIEDYIKLVTDVTSFLLLSQNSTRTVNDVAISKGISDIVESMRYFATVSRLMFLRVMGACGLVVWNLIFNLWSNLCWPRETTVACCCFIATAATELSPDDGYGLLCIACPKTISDRLS